MEMQRPKMEEAEEEEEEERKKKKWPWMKAAQLLEFQVQALVYRYIEAGLQVPHHLLVPIWNSLARSSSSSSSSNYFIHHNHSSSSLMLSEAEPEPTRCRRTDGKKWRCSRTVLPFQKYCERHIHRGRKRSRKLVESSSSSSSTKHENNTYGDQSHRGTTTMSVSNNAAQVVTVASYACPPPLAIPSKSASHSKNTPCVQKFFPEVSSDTSLEEASKKHSSNTKKNDIIARSSGKEWKNINGLLFPSIHFSPNTVLQGETDNEPGRCRRTDGKKWRCSKDVISGQKYCDKHMHRGIKKNKNHPVENTGFTPLTVARSVSILGIPLVTRVPDEKSNSSSCSTDTTITDTALRGQEEEEDDEEVLSLCCSSGV